MDDADNEADDDDGPLKTYGKKTQSVFIQNSRKHTAYRGVLQIISMFYFVHFLRYQKKKLLPKKGKSSFPSKKNAAAE